MTRSYSVRRRLVAALAAGAWAVGIPFVAVATPASVQFSVTPFPNNADEFGPAFITAGELAAFDISLQNTSGSTFTNVNMTSTTEVSATYVRTIVVGGSAAGQVSCAPAGAPAFSCALGNLAQNATLSLRVVFATPNAPGEELVFTVTGKGSGASTSDPGNSRGDTFGDDATISLVPLFLDGASERGAAEYVPTNAGAVIETANVQTGPTNPAWTRMTVAAPGPDAPIGTYGFLKEHPAAQTGMFGCPVAFCFGQAAELRYLEGQPASTPFMVEFRLDNAKASVSTPKKAVIYHVPDIGPLERPFDRTCTFAGSVPTNAPCGVSRAAAGDDKNDYVFIFWLDRNGYIRGG